MKKEFLNLQDRKIMRANNKKNKNGLFYLFIGMVFLFCCAIYSTTNSSVEYVIGVILSGLASIFTGYFWIINSFEEWLHYKLILTGRLMNKKEESTEGTPYYIFTVENKEVTVSKEDYEKYKRGQKIRVELTPLSKQTIRILPS